MGFTVIHKGSTNGSQYAKYLDEVSRQLLQRGRSFDSVPRVRDNGAGDRWLYVWDNKDEADAVADALKKKTRDANWNVTPVTEEPSVGPLRPLDLQLTCQGDLLIFGFPPFSLMALQNRFPGCCRRDAIIVRSNEADPPLPSESELLELVWHVFPMLTELSWQQLQVFGTFRLLESVSDRLLLPATPFESVSAGSAARRPSRRDAPGD